MVVEKCMIKIEDQNMMVYFNDGEKIEEEIENFPVMAALLGYKYYVAKLESIQCVFYEFNKHDSNGNFGASADLSLSFD